MADIDIRLARAEEYAEVGALSEAAYEYDYEITDSYRSSLRDVAARAATNQVWVAADASTGALLGTVSTPPPGGQIGLLGEPGELDWRLLAVAPVARRRGVGRLLVEHVIELGKARYAARVVTNSGPEMLGAHRLYEQLGFVRLPSRETQVTPEGKRLLAFGLDLTAAADGTPTRVLDNAPLASLNGPHTHFAQRRGEVSRYDPDVSVWPGLPDELTEQDWADVAGLLGPGGTVGLPPSVLPPPGWTVVGEGAGVQMIGERLDPRYDPEAVQLTPDDVPDMTALVEQTRPGPWRPRTIEMGSYVGIRRGRRLVAMAGERLHPPGFTEISAVCTDPEFRGQGLATRLVLHVAAGIRDRGETPILHAFAGNHNAIRLYEQLGFRLRLHRVQQQVQVPVGD